MIRAAGYFGTALAVFTFVAPLAAQEKKPIAVISVASHEKLMAAGNELAKIAGMPLPATPEQMLDGMIKDITKGKGLVGLDKSKPLGAVLSAGDPEDFVIFAPLGDLKGALDALPEGFQREEGEDGTMRVKIPGKPWANVKGAGGWVYAAASAKPLKQVAADPAALLGDLPERYLMAVRVKMQNLDPKMREDMLREFRNLPDEAYSKIKSMSEQLDELTIGWKVDGAAKQVVAELTVSAVAGSQLAGLAPRLADRPTRFAGLRSADAAIYFATSIEGELTPGELDEVKAAHDAALKRRLEQIDDENSIPADSKPVVKEAFSTLLAVWFDTAKSGIRDGGVAVLTQPAPAIVLGGHVSDGASVATALKRLGTLVECDPSVPEIKWDAGEHGGYKLHVMKVKPDPGIAMLVGEKVEVVAAINKESVLLATGADAMTALKKVIDGSAGGEKVPAVAFAIRIRPLLDAAAKMGPPNPMLQGLAAQLAALKPGADEATLKSVPLEQGVMFRLALNEGAIKAIVMGAMMANQAAQAPPPGFGGPPGRPEKPPGDHF